MAKMSNRKRAEAESSRSEDKQLVGELKAEPLRQGRPAVQATSRERPEKLWTVLLIGAVLFLSTLYFTAMDLPFFIGLPICMLGVMAVGALLKWRPMEQITVTCVLLSAFILLCGLASLYAKSRETAGAAFGKWFSLLCIFWIIIVACKKKHTRTLLLGLTLSIGISAVFSIDSASFRQITDFILGTLLSMDVSGFSYWGDGRISGLFTNPNISASIFGLGIFLSLYGVRSARSRKEQFLTYCSLACSSLAFLLSFSMGAIGFFAVGAVVYLLTAGREERPALFLLMLETVVSTMVFGAISTVGLGKAGAITFVPDAAVILSCIFIWQLDTRVGALLTKKLLENGRLAATVLTAGGMAAALYLVLGFNLTGAIELDAGENVSRSAYPAPGAYTLTVEGVDEIQVVIRSQNSQQTAMHTSTILYEGSAAGAQYTVPEHTRVVYFDLSSTQGGRVSAMTYSGASEGRLKLKYLLLPEFAATRIQGLWANQNVIQRVTFYGDALKIWRMSPVVGKGMGAFGVYRPQVADFFYRTRYAHNVYLETMSETGLVGLALLLAAVASLFAAVRKARKGGDCLMAPALAACLVLMWGHGSFEVIWSSKPYLIVAAVILAVIQISFGAELQAKWLQKRVARRSIAAVGGVGILTFAVLFSIQAASQVDMERAAQTSYESFMTAAEKSVRINVYGADFSRANYLNSVFIGESEAFLPTADAYAADLAYGGSHAYAVTAADYYFARGKTEEAFAALEQAALLGKSDPLSWKGVVESAMRAYREDDAEMEAGMRSLYRLWRKTNEEQADDITFDTPQREFLERYENS